MQLKMQQQFRPWHHMPDMYNAAEIFSQRQWSLTSYNNKETTNAATKLLGTSVK
jgi:hypothetical protein